MVADGAFGAVLCFSAASTTLCRRKWCQEISSREKIDAWEVAESQAGNGLVRDVCAEDGGPSVYPADFEDRPGRYVDEDGAFQMPVVERDKREFSDLYPAEFVP